ncbi:hypothetical protein [Shimia sagamensis]|uniref:DUF4123 domain-containing protein n=1 Tax=Shimia sagamensis TaxID=1566352 RepID=A0ABY1NXS1_9RHOB|nr:hypothetical protein [Shimia sagamensis]SMP20337.1 hypothetical protein SAMN06265373_103505 [Shimia sagamensis]
MPIENKILSPAPLAYRRFSGHVTMDELTSSSLALHADPAFVPGTHTVVDMLDVTDFDIGFDQMKEFAALTQNRHRDRGAPVHIFIVCSSEQGRWLAEMFRALADLAPGMASVEILHGFPEILALLDLPAETLSLFPEDCQTESHLLNRLSS